MKQLQESLTREQILLRAAAQILDKQNGSSYVLDVLSQTTVWDGATCDGYCLLEEIQDLLDMSDVDWRYQCPDDGEL